MQQSQGAWHNPALDCAMDQANARDQRLFMLFGLMGDHIEAGAPPVHAPI